MNTALAFLAFGYALALAFAVVRIIRSVPVVARLDPPAPKRWPRVSVVVTACNEADTIEHAMRTRLAEAYPNVEYIVVDDRSTDATKDIVQRLGEEDRRVVPIRIDTLPEGWLGKVHAMDSALGHATGEWVLFSDADVHHESQTLARIVAHAEANGLDHVSLFPWVWRSGFGTDVVLTTFLRVFIASSRAWNVPDPRSRASIGGGNFNLVRRSALERAGGLERLRLEVLEDVALGQQLKWSGAKQAVLNARGCVGLWFYRSIGESIRGMEKNAFAAFGRLSLVRFTFVIAALAVAELGGFVPLVAGEGASRVLAALAIVIVTLAQVVLARWLARPWLSALLPQVGVVVLLVAALRSAALAVARGGIDWRGTRYSLTALRRGMRYVQI